MHVITDLQRLYYIAMLVLCAIFVSYIHLGVVWFVCGIVCLLPIVSRYRYELAILILLLYISGTLVILSYTIYSVPPALKGINFTVILVILRVLLFEVLILMMSTLCNMELMLSQSVLSLLILYFIFVVAVRLVYFRYTLKDIIKIRKSQVILCTFGTYYLSL